MFFVFISHSCGRNSKPFLYVFVSKLLSVSDVKNVVNEVRGMTNVLSIVVDYTVKLRSFLYLAFVKPICIFCTHHWQG